MANMNNHPISLYMIESSDLSPLVREESSSSSNSHQSILIVIFVYDDSESERFSIGSLGKEASINYSSFD